MGIATIAGVILGLVVVAVSFALTRLIGASPDVTTIVMILSGCAIAGAGSFLIAHVLGLPRLVQRVQAAVVRSSFGAMLERHATGVGVIGGVGGLIAMVVVLRDPGALGGVPATALFAAVCGALLLNMWWRQNPATLDQSLTTDFGASTRAGTGSGRADDFKKAA